MNRDSLLELRVLTGSHSGARALVAAQPQTLGSGDDCALILSDEGVLAQHATLEQRPDGSTALRWLDSDLPPLVIRPGQGAWVGPVRVAVERVDAPWRDEVPMADPALTPEDLSGSPPEAREPDPIEPSAQPKRHWGRMARRGAACTAMLALAGLAIWPLVHALQNEQATQASSPHAGRHASSGSAPADALQSIVGQLGLAGRVRIDRSNPQAPVVIIGFLPEDEALALAQGLSRLSPRPRMTTVDEAELVAAVTAEIQREGGNVDAPLDVQYLGAGRFQVRGQVADEAERAMLIARLEQAFPLAGGFESTLTTRAEAGKAMVSELQLTGLGRITGEWVDGTLVLDITLPPGAQARWERALLAAVARHPLPFRALVRTGQGPEGPTTSQLPFKIRSIVSNPLPHVMLADGRKLFTGARLEGWEVKDIGRRSVVFEDPRGHKLTLDE